MAVVRPSLKRYSKLIHIHIHTMSRYRAQWRRPYRKQSLRRLNDEALSYRMQRRAAKLIRRALNGDTEALITLLKASGDLPHDYKPMY